MSYLEIRKQNAHSTSGSPNGLNYILKKETSGAIQSHSIFLSVSTIESIKSSLAA